MFTMAEDVQIFEKVNGTDILVAAELVGNPLARLPPVIQVQHRGDGGRPEPVDVIGLQPEQGAVQEKVADFGAVIIKDPTAPVRVVAKSGICVVVEMRAVKLTKS